MANIRVGNVGVQLVSVVTDQDGAAVDVSSLTKVVYLTKPNGTLLTKVGVNDSTGTDGKVRYNTISGDLSHPGTWHMQVKVTDGDGTVLYSSEPVGFKVEANLYPES